MQINSWSCNYRSSNHLPPVWVTIWQRPGLVVCLLAQCWPHWTGVVTSSVFQLSLDRYSFLNSCCYMFLPLTVCLSRHVPSGMTLSTAVIASDLARKSTFYITCRSVLPTGGCRGVRRYISFMMISVNVKFWFCLIVVFDCPHPHPFLCVTDTVYFR